MELHPGRTDNLDDKWTPEPNTGCWLWLGTLDQKGYGRCKVAGNKWRSGLAHRAVYEKHVGPIPPGMSLCHKCDTPLCVNPAHMFLGSHSDNHIDCAMKGRSGNAKVTPAQVVEMRRLYATGDYTQIALARMFGLSRTAGRNALRGETWKRAG